MGKQKRRQRATWAQCCCVRKQDLEESDDWGRRRAEGSAVTMRPPAPDQDVIEVAVEASEDLLVPVENLVAKSTTEVQRNNSKIGGRGDVPQQQKVKLSIRKAPSFLCDLPVSLNVGYAVIVDGNVKPNAMRLSVNLTCGGPDADIAFHLNPRFQEKVVVRNSKVHDHWGNEERSCFCQFPFTRGERFVVCILCSVDEFMVAVNGKHYCLFKYRVPLTRVQVVRVSGDLTLNMMDYKECKTYPIFNDTEDHILPLTKSMSFSNEIDKTGKRTPLIFILPDKFNADSEVEIVGKIKLLPHLFFVNLQEGTQMWPHPVIPLHVKPPLGDQAPFLVCNSWSRGHWGIEEKILVRNMRPGHEFKLKIKCETDEYIVHINDVDTVKFKHRLPFSVIDCLYVYGDVWISDITIR